MTNTEIKQSPKIKLKCSKCGEEKIGEQRFEYVCCDSYMERSPLDNIKEFTTTKKLKYENKKN